MKKLKLNKMLSILVMSCNFMTCNFMPCNFDGPSFSCPSFSAPPLYIFTKNSRGLTLTDRSVKCRKQRQHKKCQCHVRAAAMRTRSWVEHAVTPVVIALTGRRVSNFRRLFIGASRPRRPSLHATLSHRSTAGHT